MMTHKNATREGWLAAWLDLFKAAQFSFSLERVWTRDSAESKTVATLMGSNAAQNRTP